MILNPNEKYYKFCPNCKAELQKKDKDKVECLYCPNCDFVFWNNPKPVVSIVLHKNNKVLMLQRKNEPHKGYWCLPGGYINYNETLEEAIKRETLEEAGLNIDVGKLVGVYRIDNDPRGINIDIIYEGCLEGEIKISDEHEKYELYLQDKLPTNIAYKHREAINDWYKIK